MQSITECNGGGSSRRIRVRHNYGVQFGGNSHKASFGNSQESRCRNIGRLCCGIDRCCGRVGCAGSCFHRRFLGVEITGGGLIGKGGGFPLGFGGCQFPLSRFYLFGCAGCTNVHKFSQPLLLHLFGCNIFLPSSCDGLAGRSNVGTGFRQCTLGSLYVRCGFGFYKGVIFGRSFRQSLLGYLRLLLHREEFIQFGSLLCMLYGGNRIPYSGSCNKNSSICAIGCNEGGKGFSNFLIILNQVRCP